MSKKKVVEIPGFVTLAWFFLDEDKDRYLKRVAELYPEEDLPLIARCWPEIRAAAKRAFGEGKLPR